MIRIREWPARWTFLGLTVVGFLLFIASYVLGVDAYSAPIPGGAPGATRETGYAAAINWSLNLVVIFPVAAYFMLSALESVEAAMVGIAKRGMARDANGEPISAERLLHAWRKDTPFRRGVLAGSVLLAAAISYGEWFIQNVVPLVRGKLRAGDPEIDWGLVHIDKGPLLRFANGLFDFAAFTMQAVMIASVLSFFLLMLHLPSILTPRAGEITIYPDLRSEDRRRGFEEFEATLSHTLYASLFAYMLFYASRLQNLYLRDTAATTLWTFVQNDVIRGFKDWSSLLALGTNAQPSSDFSSIMVALAGAVLIILTLLVVSGTIRDAAACAKRNAVAFHRDNPGTLFPQPREREEKQRKTTVVWPLKYLPFNLLLAICLAAAATIIFYRLGLATFGLVLAAVVTRVVKRIIAFFRISRSDIDDITGEPQTG